MTPERWRQVATLYEAVLARAPAERAEYLEREFCDDLELRLEVETLLAHADRPVIVDQSVWEAADGFVDIDPQPTLAEGYEIGPYRVGPLLGIGGMGHVYRARDTKLQRDVALKILPEEFVQDDRVARFTREAHVLASLNHTNIGAIYGFEQSAHVHALVLELVDAPTLADRIARGPLPLDEALGIARQIVDGLEAAHALGIVHRDLKPSNIKVREDGVVKVLDFGLAKLQPTHQPADVEPGPSVDLNSRASSPPLEANPEITAAGRILGTAAYMSPEQARGATCDKRSDIWAFGCVLYEMLAGKRAFAGRDVADTLAVIIEREPDWDAIRHVPAPLQRLLARCLQKDRRRRLADIADARLEFDVGCRRCNFQPCFRRVCSRSKPHHKRGGQRCGNAGCRQGPSELRSARRVSARMLLFTSRRMRIRAGNGDVWLLDVAHGALTRLTTEEWREAHPVWSPDMRRIVFSSQHGGVSDLYVKELDGGVRTLLSDGRSRSAIDWSADGKFLLFQSLRPGSSDIWAMAMEGERKEFPVVQTPFEERNAQFSPDGRWIAYESNLSGRFEIYAQPFGRSGARQQLSTTGGAQVRWARDRRELFYIALDGSLMTVPFTIASDSQSIQWGSPVRLFETHIGGAVQVPPEHQYVVFPDGQRFLMDTIVSGPSSPIVVILNWSATGSSSNWTGERRVR